VAERGALLGFAVHRPKQGVDVDETAFVDAGQQRSLLRQRDQVPAQYRRKLAGVAVGELAQQDSQRGVGIHPAEELFHATGPDDIQIVDALRPGGHPGDDRGQLRCRVGRTRFDPFAGEPHMLVQQRRQSGLFSQLQQRHQTRMRHEIVLVEHRAIAAPDMRSLHRECPSKPVCSGS
jgi:hypothetical protein